MRRNNPIIIQMKVKQMKKVIKKRSKMHNKIFQIKSRSLKLITTKLKKFEIHQKFRKINKLMILKMMKKFQQIKKKKNSINKN